MPDGTPRWGVPFVEHRLEVALSWSRGRTRLAAATSSKGDVFFRRQEQVVSHEMKPVR